MGFSATKVRKLFEMKPFEEAGKRKGDRTIVYGQIETVSGRRSRNQTVFL
jgi:hypothetical protein